MKPNAQFRLRIRLGETVAVGPGKIALLEAVAETGSISAAARGLGMSYRRAWLLIDEMNKSLREPAVETATGGTKGGGAALTARGEKLIRLYRAIEQKARDSTAGEISMLARLLKD